MTDQRGTGPGVVREILEEEQRALEESVKRAAGATDPQERFVLEKVVEVRSRAYAELRGRLEEMEANAEITRKMNEMFW